MTTSELETMQRRLERNRDAFATAAKSPWPSDVTNAIRDAIAGLSNDVALVVKELIDLRRI